jgi:microcompartment protein CcmK/EutM
MYLGRVAGCVWATVKDPGLQGQRLLVIQPLTPDLQDTGKPLICTDCTGAGAGEIIYWVRGREASLPFPDTHPPTDTTVVGIVDEVRLRRAATPEAPC